METVVLTLLLRGIIISWDSALQHINTILHCSKIIVRLFLKNVCLVFFFKMSLCRSLWKDRDIWSVVINHMQVLIIPPQILAYYLYLTLPLSWKMVEVASVAAACCFICSLRCIEMSFSLRQIQISLLSPRSHLHWGKKPVEVMLINSVQDEDWPPIVCHPTAAPYWMVFSHFMTSSLPLNACVFPDNFTCWHLAPSSALRWGENFRYSWSVNFTVQTKS